MKSQTSKSICFVFITYECYPLPIAHHLIEEGYEVIVGLINDRSQQRIPGLKNDETFQQKRNRVTNYDGLIKKLPLNDVLSLLRKIPTEEKDHYFIFFDFPDLCKLAELVLKMGFKNGLFPTEFYYTMENDRDAGKAYVRKHYDRIKVAEEHAFQKVQDGIKFLNENDGVFVLKGNMNMGKTVVPKSDDPAIARAQIIDSLEKFRKEYEAHGFILEQKILNCLEVTPVMVFYNGEPVYSLAEFENKEIAAGNIGAQKGGNQALSVRTALDCELNKIAFPPKVYELAKKQPGMLIFDAGLLFDGNDFYFGEYAGNRYGWDGAFSEIVMRDKGAPFVGSYFENIMNGENPLRNKYGISVRLFNYEGDREQTFEPKCDLPMFWSDEIENNLFLYRAKKTKEGQIVATAGMDFVGVMTAASDNLESAINKVYKRIEMFDFERLLYRPKFDFMSRDYRTSIFNRMDALEEFLK